MKIRILFLACSTLMIASTSLGQSKSIKKIDKYIESSRQLWNIPGVAVSIVKDGETLLSKGYGVKDVRTEEPVDDETLFAVASNTKAFTAACLAILIDEGRMSWDDRVVDYLPWFELYDPYVSQNMTVRDLLCHRSGLDTFSGDLIWYGSSHSREEVVKRAKFLEPAYGFREHFGYQNIMFLAAGLVVEEVSGMSWDEFVKLRILDPLGMENTVSTIRDFTPSTNLAAPHNLQPDGTNLAIDWVNWDNIAPAGSLVSSVEDMSHWLQAQVNLGEYYGEKLWSEDRAYEMWELQTPESISGWSRANFPTKTFAGYALGWEIENLYGHKIVSHGGGYDGMISKTIMIPDEKIGIVIVTNSINWLSSALGNYILDELIGDGADRDWAADYLGFKTGQDEAFAAANAEAEANRAKDSKPSLALEAYAGTYGGPMYGDCTVTVEGDHLAFKFEPTPLFQGTFTHWQHDSFKLDWTTDMMLPSGLVQFILNPQGEIEEMIIDVPNPDFYFTELEFKRSSKR